MRASENVYEEEVKGSIFGRLGTYDEADGGFLRVAKCGSQVFGGDGAGEAPSVPVFEESVFALGKNFGDVTAAMVVQAVETFVFADFVEQSHEVVVVAGDGAGSGIFWVVDVFV